MGNFDSNIIAITVIIFMLLADPLLSKKINEWF